MRAVSGTGSAGLRVGVTARVARALNVSIACAGCLAAAITVLGASAPVPRVAVDPATVTPDGGSAYKAAPGFGVRWPYVIPSHPTYDLEPGDVRVAEDGVPIGALQPSHAAIRAQGGGAFNLWEGTLWFSASDNTDPRTNGRSYVAAVRSRLPSTVVLVRDRSLLALVALLLARLGLLAIPGVVRGGRSTSRACLAACRSVHDLGTRAVAFARLSFGRFYAAAGTLALAAFVWGTLARPAPLFTQPDSYSYIIPGLIWASGQDVTGQSDRDIGYPLLTVLAVRLGSLALLPRIQIAMVAAGMACLLAALYLPLPALASRLERAGAVPRWVSTAVAACLAAAFVGLLASHDLFVVDIESAMAEAPHVLPTALAALLFVGAWTAGPGPRRVGLLAAASLAAYASAMFKPHSLLVVPLCLAGLAWAGLRSPGAFRSRPVVLVVACSAVLAFGINRLEALVTPRGADFGPKILFCNHLDVIEPVFARSSPERIRVAGMMLDTLSRVDGWPLMGYSGDGCIYNDAFGKAIVAAAEAEGETAARWQMREFLLGIAKNPLRYAGDAWRQSAFFLSHPVNDADVVAHSDLDDADAKVLAPFASAINMPRSSWNVDVSNWVAVSYPHLTGPAKEALQAIAASFAWVTLAATAIAAALLAVSRGKRDLRPETAVVATACFTGSFAATVILTHSFDVGRYLTDLMPISLLWWFFSAAYLGHAAVLVAAWAATPLFRGRLPKHLAAPVGS